MELARRPTNSLAFFCKTMANPNARSVSRDRSAPVGPTGGRGLVLLDLVFLELRRSYCRSQSFWQRPYLSTTPPNFRSIATSPRIGRRHQHWSSRTVDPKVFGNGRICQQVLQTSDQLQHPRGLVAATNTGVPSIRRVNATRDFERTLAWFP